MCVHTRVAAWSRMTNLNVKSTTIKRVIGFDHESKFLTQRKIDQISKYIKGNQSQFSHGQKVPVSHAGPNIVKENTLE